MAKKKEWRVRAEYDGKVALESTKQRVVLSNSLPQEQLAALARTRPAAGFMERITVNVSNDVKDQN